MSAVALARALYAFQGSQEGDLSFQEDAIIRVLRQDESGWWEGQTDDGRRGDFPYNYVELISPEEVDGIRETSRMVTENRSNRSRNPAQQQKGVDAISKAKVHPIPKTASFTVDVILARKKVSAKKSMPDFRDLDATLRFIYPNFDRPLPPMWADKAYISEEASKKRARVLELYLQKLLGNAVAEFALMHWADARQSFGAAGEVKAAVKSAVASGARNNGAGRNSFNVAMMNVFPLARVEFDWMANDAVELTFRKGDVVAIRSTETSSKGWWEGETSDGQRGLFPSNYVSMLNQAESRNVVLGEQQPSSSPLPASSSSMLMRSPTRKNSKSPSGKKGTTTGTGQQRPKKTENNFAMPSLDAFDELLIEGFTMLANNKVFTPSKNANSPCEGDTVTLSYTGYVWDCQKQRIIEFSASDTPPEGGPMKFTIGRGETIKALERAVQNLELGQTSRIIVRPDLGYGDVGSPPSVPPNCHLVYDVRLEAFDAASLPGPPPPSAAAAAPSAMMADIGMMPAQFHSVPQTISPYRQMQQSSNSNNGGAGGGAPGMGQPKTLVEAISKQAPAAQRLTGNSNTNNNNSSAGMLLQPQQGNVPIGARPKRQAPHAKKNKVGKKGKKKNGGGGGGGGANTPRAAPPAASTVKYDLNKMREIVDNKAYERFQVDQAYVEDQLTDQGFQDAFHCDRAAFILMPKWKQNKLKKDAGLY